MRGCMEMKLKICCQDYGMGVFILSYDLTIFPKKGRTGPDHLIRDQSAELVITQSRVGPQMCVGTSIFCSLEDEQTLLHYSSKVS